MPRANDKQWHLWRCGEVPGAVPERTVDVIACGPQQARKCAAALWMARYVDVTATCLSRRLPTAEGHGPRPAPAYVVQRYAVPAGETRTRVRLVPQHRGGRAAVQP